MGSLVFNFIKRALIVPAVVTGIILSAFLFYFNTWTENSLKKLETQTPQTLDLSGYPSMNYDSFADLQSGALAGTIQSSEMGLNETAVLYNVTDGSEVSLSKSSAEPWNNGGMIVIGQNTEEQFKSLHNADKGQSVTVSLTGKDAYQYTITDIKIGMAEKDITSYYAENTLVMALPYKNLADDGKLYTLYIAEQE